MERYRPFHWLFPMAFDGSDPNLKLSRLSASSCRYCMNYMPLGRRGGHCQQLAVPVQSGWKACPLAIPAFTSSWETLETLLDWHQEEDSLLVEKPPLSDPSKPSPHDPSKVSAEISF